MNCTLTFIAACLSLGIAGLSIAAGMLARAQLLEIEASLAEILAMCTCPPSADHEDVTSGRHRADEVYEATPDSVWAREPRPAPRPQLSSEADAP